VIAAPLCGQGIEERGAAMSFRHDGRRILVTGAANGLGLGIARTLATAGARVVLADVDPKVLERAQEAGLAGRATALVRDLAEPDAALWLIEQSAAAVGSLDGLVNCAAWSFHKPAIETTLEEFDRVVAINQRAPYFLACHFKAQLSPADADPCIVNIASVNALVGNPNLIAYAGTKGALVAMTRAFAVEFAPRIRVVAISPGAVRTHVTNQLIESGEIDPAALVEKTLVKRFIAVDEIAELVLFVFSPAARSITGANWVFDGGYTAQ
jgi:NAD(P)-dependent dehydrogenase (short-subunit alcohol dehydrogenase family)